MTRTLKFYGCSDDLFEIKGTVPGDGEPDEVPVGLDDLAMIVIAQYSLGDSGCWSIGVAPVDEDYPMPEWPVRLQENDNGYSAELIVEAPSGGFVSMVYPATEENE